MRTIEPSVELFPSLTTAELRDAVETFQNFPELLFAIYREVCRTHRLGSDALDRIEELYRLARQRELEEELSALAGFRSIWAQEQEEMQASFEPLTFVEKATAGAAEAEHPQQPSQAEDWQSTAEAVRHAQLSTSTRSIDLNSLSSEEWAAHSPLALLGYRVGQTGLTDLQRQQFLADFLRRASLPSSLPTEYLGQWGKPGTKARLMKTVNHITFLKRFRERADADRYRVAINHWARDILFLNTSFADLV